MSQWRPNLAGKVPQELDRAIRIAYDHIFALQAKLSSNGHSTAAPPANPQRESLASTFINGIRVRAGNPGKNDTVIYDAAIGQFIFTPLGSASAYNVSVTAAPNAIPQATGSGVLDSSWAFPPLVAVSGPCNGVNTAFVLPSLPVDASSVRLYKRILNFGGVLVFATVDYTIAGTAITWIDATTLPQTGDLLFASFV